MKVLKRLAVGRNILILLAFFLLIIFLVAPQVYPTFQTLDTLNSYTPQKAYELISSYGNQGRQYYMIIELTLDIIYPFISALMFSLITLYTFQRAFPKQPWLCHVAWIPFVVMLADYLENISIVTMLIAYPRQLPIVAQIADFFTETKNFLTPFELLFLVGLIFWLARVVLSRIQVSKHAGN
jgi:hypothetical protein